MEEKIEQLRERGRMGIINTREDAIQLIRGFEKEENESNIHLGLAGSFSRNTHDSESDIDIVVEYETETDDIVFFSKRLKAYIERMTDRNYDIIWLNQLKRQDEEQRQLMSTLGIIDEQSAYKTILRDVIWIA